MLSGILSGAAGTFHGHLLLLTGGVYWRLARAWGSDEVDVYPYSSLDEHAEGSWLLRVRGLGKATSVT